MKQQGGFDFRHVLACWRQPIKGRRGRKLWDSNRKLVDHVAAEAETDRTKLAGGLRVF
jgi:hypothetical protein